MSIDELTRFCKLCKKIFIPQDKEEYCKKCLKHKIGFEENIRHKPEVSV
jgi:hypothetical protein